MSTVVKENVDALNAKIIVTLKPEDINPKLNTELKKLKNTASLKGFRKGKTPLGFIKKMYGQGVMSDVVNKMIQEELSKFLQEEKIQFLGQPIPAEDQEQIDLNVNEVSDMVFKFDLGLTPEFEVKGLDHVFDHYTVALDEKAVEGEIENMRKQLGDRKEVEKNIEEGDFFKVDAEEVKEDGSTGWATTISLLYKSLTPESQKLFLGKDKGDEVEFDVTKLESEKDDKYIRKYILSVTDADADAVIGNNFNGKITEILRVFPGEFTEDNIKKAFGPDTEIKDEAGVREFISGEMSKWSLKQSDSILMREIHDKLIDANDIEFPKEFLQRWLKTSSDDPSRGDTDEAYQGFVQGLKWRLIGNKLAEKHDVKVEEADILEAAKANLRQMFGGGAGLDDAMMTQYAKQMMEQEEFFNRSYASAFNDKILHVLKDEVATNKKEVSKEELDKVMETYRQKDAPAPEAVTEEE